MFDYTHQYSLSVLVNDRTEADEYAHTDGNTYIEARAGSEYSLNFQNMSAERVVVVPAIDGLSTIDGKPAGIESPSYVVEAHGQLKITGWLKNESEAARFVFWDKQNSYANQTGHGNQNTGVIGVLVFREKPKPPVITWTNSTYSFNSTSPLVGSSAPTTATGMGITPVTLENNLRSHDRRIVTSASTQEAGTGHGRLEEFKTTKVDFEKRDPAHPDAQIVLYYDTGKSLEKKGIVLRYKQGYAPDPFPTAPHYIKNTR